MKRITSLFFIFAMVLTLMLPAFTTKVYADGNGIGSGIEDFDVEWNNGTLKVDGAQGDGATQGKAWDKIFGTMRTAITGIAGVATLVFMIFLIKNIISFGAAAGNTQKREEASKGILWCGIATAGLGAITMFFGIFYNLFNG